MSLRLFISYFDTDVQFISTVSTETDGEDGTSADSVVSVLPAAKKRADLFLFLAL